MAYKDAPLYIAHADKGVDNDTEVLHIIETEVNKGSIRSAIDTAVSNVKNWALNLFVQK